MISPLMAPIKYKIKIMDRFSFMFLFLLSKRSIPTPALEHSPAISEPKGIIPMRKHSVNITEIAQLGMSPMSDTINGCRKVNFCIKVVIVSIPNASVIIESRADVIRINIKILIVCLSAHLSIPELQAWQV